jgi:hypothetical protein
MFVSIRVQGRPAEDPLREHLDRRLRTAVRPFGAGVTGVALRATTAPGERADRTTCRLVIALAEGRREIIGAGRGANVYFAADAAIDRAVRAMARALGGDDERWLEAPPGPRRDSRLRREAVSPSGRRRDPDPPRAG